MVCLIQMEEMDLSTQIVFQFKGLITTNLKWRPKRNISWCLPFFVLSFPLLLWFFRFRPRFDLVWMIIKEHKNARIPEILYLGKSPVKIIIFIVALLFIDWSFTMYMHF